MKGGKSISVSTKTEFLFGGGGGGRLGRHPHKNLGLPIYMLACIHSLGDSVPIDTCIVLINFSQILWGRERNPIPVPPYETLIHSYSLCSLCIMILMYLSLGEGEKSNPSSPV